MQCYSVVAERKIIATPSFRFPLTYVAPELYPKTRPGIRIPSGQARIRLDDSKTIAVSRALMRSNDRSRVEREGDTLVVLRASLLLNDDNEPELVPERLHNEQGAIALLDPGRGSYAGLRFSSDASEIAALGSRTSDVFFDKEEIALAVFPGFRALNAYRTIRRWACFGLTVTAEKLQFRFDGSQVVLEHFQTP